MRYNRVHNLIAAALLAAGAIWVPAVTHARGYVAVYTGPPAPRVETVPAARAGYAWNNGYWHWNGHRYVWRAGHFVAARPGHHWVAHRWERRGDRWYAHNGYWARG